MGFGGFVSGQFKFTINLRGVILFYTKKYPVFIRVKAFRKRLIILRYKEGIVHLEFLNDTGEGRKVRHAKIGALTSIRIMKDVSVIEYYINDGEYVFTTRYYPVQVEDGIINVVGHVKKSEIWEMGGCR